LVVRSLSRQAFSKHPQANRGDRGFRRSVMATTLEVMLPPPGGAAEMPRSNIFRYVATSGWHQLVLVLLTVAVFLLEVVPLELQRRIVNDLVKHREFSFIVSLAAVYAGAVLVQGGTKLVLNVYRSWVGERATRDLRRRVQSP
jgi:hypothetical protein